MSEKHVKYQIIFLNGPSSCGKSEIAKALQGSLEQPFLHVGIDKIIGMMPNKLNNWEGGFSPLGFSWKAVKDNDGSLIQELRMGDFAKKISQTYQEIILTLAKLGHFLIIDNVAVRTKIKQWKEFLRDYQVLYVGIYAPLDVIETREKNRGDRMLGSARAQFKKVHKDASYDLCIDTHEESLEKNVANIISHFNL